MILILLIMYTVLPFLLAGDTVIPIEPVDRYNHEEWTKRHGLSDTYIFQVMQDRDGYIWLATASGPVRFDGVRFNFIRDGVLNGQGVYSLLEDRPNGTLLMGMEGKIARYRYSDKTVSILPLTGAGNSRVNCLKTDSQKNLWAGTDGAGVYRQSGDTLTRFHVGNGLASDVVKAIHITGDNRVLAGTTLGLHIFRKDTITIYKMVDGLPADEVRAFCETDGNTIWIATLKGLAVLKNNRITTIHFPGQYRGQEITALLSVREGIIWMNVTNRGIVAYDHVNPRFYHPLPNAPFKNTFLYSMIRDREKNIWFGGHGKRVK